MIIADVNRPGNIRARTAVSFRDGQFTRYVEVIGGLIQVFTSDNPDVPMYVHNTERVPDNMQVMSLSVVTSGVDGRILVTLGGFTIGGDDSRRLTVKLDIAALNPWERY